jgi:hypothetical protein
VVSRTIPWEYCHHRHQDMLLWSWRVLQAEKAPLWQNWSPPLPIKLVKVPVSLVVPILSAGWWHPPC